MLEVESREMGFTLKKEKITTNTPSPASSSSSSLQQTMARRTIYAMLLSIKIVFNSWIYIVLTGAVAAIFWIVFNIFDQLLFFSPVCILPTMRCIRRLCPFKHNCDSSGHHGEHEHICAQTFA